MAIRIRNDRRNAVVRLKPHTFAVLVSYEFERGVLVMRRVKIATGEEWPDPQR